MARANEFSSNLKVWLVMSTLALTVTSAQADGGVWDLRADWSDAQNPNGAWSYNSDGTALPHVSGSTMPGGGLVNQPGWAACSSCRGFWFKASVPMPNNDWQDGDIIVHTQDQYASPYDHAANVTWTSPIAGTVSVKGQLWMDDAYPDRGTQWNVYVKGLLVTSGQLTGLDPYDRSAPASLLQGTGGGSVLTDIDVLPGDVIKLEIVRTTTNGFFVSPDLTISAVPEPAAVAMWMAGVGMLVWRFSPAARRRESTG